MNNSILFITGPTAIGKSDLAIKLSKEINGEIINADSMQIYRELKVITARPTNIDIKLINLIVIKIPKNLIKNGFRIILIIENIVNC